LHGTPALVRQLHLGDTLVLHILKRWFFAVVREDGMKDDDDCLEIAYELNFFIFLFQFFLLFYLLFLKFFYKLLAVLQAEKAFLTKAGFKV
jgi:hypothetical protein